MEEIGDDGKVPRDGKLVGYQACVGEGEAVNVGEEEDGVGS